MLFLIKKCLSPGPVYSRLRVFCLVTVSVVIVLPIGFWILLPGASFVKKIHQIKNILLKTDSPYKLSSLLFAELLDLSVDRPRFLQDFSTRQAESLLQQTEVFSSVLVEKASDTKGIIVSYSLHRPIGYVGNATNLLFNREGQVFPCRPFFPVLNLPKVFFSEDDLKEGRLPGFKLQAIFTIFDVLPFPPAGIDLSTMQRYPGEIVVLLESGAQLRLTEATLEQGLKRYLQAVTQIDSLSTAVCDLRHPGYLLVKFEDST